MTNSSIYNAKMLKINILSNLVRFLVTNSLALISFLTLFLPYFSFAQECDGTLSEPIIVEDFGSGTGLGPMLPEGTTPYTYGSIGAGNYVVTNTSDLYVGWHDAPDNTPNDVNGYFLLFDSFFQPEILYNKVFDNLCPNTTYVFSCFAANVLKLPTNQTDPNLEFRIMDSSTFETQGVFNTGSIVETSEMTWIEYFVTFTTKADQEEVLVRIENTVGDGFGNDIAIDDLSFRECTFPIPVQYITLCPGESVTINGTDYFADTITGDTFTVVNCSGIITHVINVVELDISLETAEFNFSTDVLLTDESVQLFASSNYADTLNYQWTPSNFLSCSDCEDPVFSASESGLYNYNLIGRDFNSGCADTISFTFDVKSCKSNYFPTAFSPNFDGVNDYFKPFLNDCVERVSTFKIFGRWGDLVHSQENTSPNETRWDGSVNSSELPIGVYSYYLNVQYIDGTFELFTGDITLVR